MGAMDKSSVLGICIIICAVLSECAEKPLKFPNDFLFGISSSAYQIEGAWDEDGKGESIWDRMVHTRSELIVDRSTGDVACDSYHQPERDIEMVSDLGVDYYRFSIAWTRIMPKGTTNVVNSKGVLYYNNLINELLARNITPVVTMFHWDLPQLLQDLGGWTNPLMADYFVDYADFLFMTYGDRVKTWFTINEPRHICFGYSTLENAPALNNSAGVADYLCAHTVLKAHARAYRLYEEKYAPLEGGRISIVIDSDWIEADSDSEEDIEIAETRRQFFTGLYAHPIFSKTGDYPPIVRKLIDEKSYKQGFSRSRLPTFTEEEKLMIKGSADFFALNHYTSYVAVKLRDGEHSFPIPSLEDDCSSSSYQRSTWPASDLAWLKFAPWGFRKTLNWIKNEYNNPTILVAENGYGSLSGIEDDDKIEYYTAYLDALLRAKFEDNCTIIGYGLWTLMDGFEWQDGYRSPFGLYEVDFDSPSRPRTIRKSGLFYRDLIKTRFLPENR